MVIVKKENQVLHVDEAVVNSFLADGFDQVELDGNEYKVVKRATGGRTVSLAQYNALLDENERLKEQLKSKSSKASGK
jgi:hypothetical protein